MDSLFGLRRWGRQQYDDRSSSSSSRRTVDLSDDAPSAFAMSAPTITPVRTGSGSSAQTPRLSMDRQYGAVSPVPSAPLTPTTASTSTLGPQVPLVPLAHRSAPETDVAALRKSLLSRLPDLRTTRPPDVEVELMFADLITRRDMLSGPSAPPPAALSNMFDFSLDKKWTLVYNDLLTTQASERDRVKRFVPNAASAAAASSVTPMVLVRNSPEWFIKKFMDNSVTTKHIESLAVTLRTCAIGWLQSFVEAKGTHVLSSYLIALQTRGSMNEQDLAQEYEVLKAFRSLFNSKPGAHDALQHPKCITGISRSLVSQQLSTRKQAADILLFLCHWEKPRGHSLVLQGMDELRVAFDRHGRFDAWFTALEAAIDGRGRMGSLVGASDEVRRLQMSAMPEAGLPEYVVNNMFLVNALVNSDIVDALNIRVHLRSQMAASGLLRIMEKMRALSTPDLDNL